MISLRTYQSECVNSILSAMDRGVTRQLISLATGLGKTVVFSGLAKLLNRRTIIVAHRDELISQAKEKLIAIWPEILPEIGIVKGAFHDPGKKIVIASIQSAARDRRLKDLQGNAFGLMIVDEAHHGAAPSYERLAKSLGFLMGDPDKLLLGVTATPKRGDGAGLSSMFEEIVFQRSIVWGIRNGYLSPLKGMRISTKVSLSGVQSQAGDFVASQLSRTINLPGRNRLVAESFAKYGSTRRKAVAFCADVKHALDLATEFNAQGISAKTIHGKTSLEERRRILSDFAIGKVRVLTNCGVLTEGFDSEDIDSILLCRPTRSQALFIQCVGRGARVAPGKTDCLVIDFVDSSRLGLCNFENSLEGAVSPILEPRQKNEEEPVIEPVRVAEKIDAIFEASEVKDIDFFGRSSFAWMQVGDAWHLPAGGGKDVWVRKVSATGYKAMVHDLGVTYSISDSELPLSFAIGCAEDWMRLQASSALAQKDARWRLDPATEKQLATLQKFGVFNAQLTKGEAFDLLRVKIHGRNNPFRGGS